MEQEQHLLWISFFSGGTNLLSPNTNVCVLHRHMQTNTNESVFLWAQMLCLRITWFLAGLGVTVTRDQDLEHTSLHTHHTQRHITTLLLCAATFPAHTLQPSAVLSGTVLNQLSFQNPGKREKELFLTFKNSFSVYFTWLPALFTHPF